ncbi:hypothetical protein PENTCL1PPCAC_22556 [Pristionchus entomophagus]|uniref:BTB domain-containing protein n=1 Tax=Pristionchus entomophagus TaxID=358040 RepID=A0AAV5U0S4_9BILA|nr:hypothetical protein PENTCL1PPCAC_22556 [Pristionchus entomophagus]
MATLDDSGVGSAACPGVTPVTSQKKRPRVNTSGKTPTSALKKRKLSIGQDRSKWLHFELDVPGDDFLTKERMESEAISIEDSEWSLGVYRRRRENENGQEVMMEVSLQCAVPSAAWCAKCKIELEVATDDRSDGRVFKKSFDCMINSSSSSRGILLDWRKMFLSGGRVSAYLLITRICNKFLSFPDFSDPSETGNDELICDNQVLYVDKSLLALNSKFFARLFSSSNGPYRLEGRVEDIVATLQTVYPQKGSIDESNACTIAVIAKEFEFWDTLERCENYLLTSDKFSIIEKMEASLRCQMHSLLSQCSEGLYSVGDVIRLMDNQPDGFQASEKTKAYLFDLILMLNKRIKTEEVVLD